MASPAWTPPSDPRPSDILDSAVRDTRDGSYEQAFAKFLWFHANALQYERGLSAVRLSFAISYWLELAEVYPPAHDAFMRTRDEAEIAFQRDFTNFELFREIASLNRPLGCGLRTADLFSKVADSDRSAAQPLYHVAEPYLIEAGRYHQCGPFLDAEKRLNSAVDFYHISLQYEASTQDSDLPDDPFARNYFIEDVATTVALLVLNDRAKEARDCTTKAFTTLDDPDFRRVMDAAMTGHFPKGRSA